jgi:hypothetical protein
VHKKLINLALWIIFAAMVAFRLAASIFFSRPREKDSSRRSAIGADATIDAVRR